MNEEEEPKEEEITEEMKLQNEAEEFKDKYYRLLAESENQRKRLHKEKLDSTRFAIGNIICEFLQPLDHMENALQHAEQMEGEVKQWALGFHMILGQFQEVLGRNGIHPFDAINTHFDPEKHEAVDTVETEEAEPGTVVEEYQKGYRLDGRIIRPAKVKVAKAIAQEKVIENTINGEDENV